MKLKEDLYLEHTITVFILIQIMSDSKIFYLILTILLCTSCGVLKPKYITQVQYDTTVIYKNNNVYQHDSIYVFKDRYIYTKGDTVYSVVTEYKDRWKIKEVHDTTYKDKIVYQDKEIPVEVEKPLTGFQKFFINFGKLSACLLVLAIAAFAVKKFVFKL